jgi:hypothetical protein
MWTKPLAGVGIFHPVEPDAASAPTIRMHGVDVPRPNYFRRHRQDRGRRPGGLGGRALGLWDRGEERGRPGTPRREGDADGVAEPRSTARPEIQPPRRRVGRVGKSQAVRTFRATQRTRSPCAGWPSRCPPFSRRRRPPRGQRAGDHQDNPAPDLHGVIGKALIEAAQQRDVDGGGWDTVLPMRIQQHAQQLPVQVVHHFVFFNADARCADRAIPAPGSRYRP